MSREMSAHKLFYYPDINKQTRMLVVLNLCKTTNLLSLQTEDRAFL